MEPAALIATMVALAAPNAHGPTTISCDMSRSDVGAYAVPWKGELHLSPFVCRSTAKVVMHRHTSPWSMIGIMDLLHEAAHVGQWRERVTDFTDPSHWYEHDAECRALAGLPRALYTLHYRTPFVRTAVAVSRKRIEQELPPYGGTC